MDAAAENQVSKDFSMAAKWGNIEKMESLLAQGADVNFNDGQYCLPLFMAAINEREEAVAFLLANGAAPDLLNYNPSDIDATPLAAAAYSGNMPIIKMLLAAGADPNALTSQKKTPEHYAGNQKKTEVQDFLKKMEYANDVTFNCKVGDILLEEHFNFARAERVTFAIREKDGVVDSFQRESFSKVETAVLKKAFNAYVRRGGLMDEALVFPEAVIKCAKPRIGLG